MVSAFVAAGDQDFEHFAASVAGERCHEAFGRKCAGESAERYLSGSLYETIKEDGGVHID